VKRFPQWGLLVLVLLLGYLFSMAAAQGPSRGAGPNIALLDVNYIFKNHARFKGAMADMKTDVQRAEEQVKQEREAISGLAERLNGLNKGTRDYQQLEEELAKRQANLAVRVSLTKNEFMQREATIYNNVYQEILQATDYYAKQNAIDMVLRFNGDKVDPQKPDSVLAFINKPVVWYQQQMDITPAILQELNRTALNPGMATPPGRPGVPFQR
jgi:Skp family chaperone for outer membrane proteins